MLVEERVKKEKLLVELEEKTQKLNSLLQQEKKSLQEVEFCESDSGTVRS